MSDDVMNTGDICRRLGYIVTVELLLSLGFEPARKDKRASIWKQDDYQVMCQELARYTNGRSNVPMQPAPPKKATVAGAAAPSPDEDY